MPTATTCTATSTATPTDNHGHADTPQGWLDRKLGGLSVYQAVRPIAIGVVHGLAGSAAIALLVLAQIRDPLLSVVYLLLFGVGTVAGMMLVTSVIAVPFAMSRERLPYLHLWLQLAAGLLSLGLGIYLGWQLGVQSGLLVGDAQLRLPLIRRLCLADPGETRQSCKIFSRIVINSLKSLRFSAPQD